MGRTAQDNRSADKLAPCHLVSVTDFSAGAYPADTGFFKSLEELIERLAKVKYKGIEAEFDLDKLRDVASEHSSELAQELLIKIDAPPEHKADDLVDE